jgi:hypothetical protein
MAACKGLNDIYAVAVLTYWLRDKVRRYFGVEQTGKLKAIAIVGACAIAVLVLITLSVLAILFIGRIR